MVFLLRCIDYTGESAIRIFARQPQIQRGLNSARRTVVYRVVHSAFTNVAQHAQASRVKVSIREIEDLVHLEISDNGKSFDVQQVSHATRNKRLGLLGMRERVEMVGGNFNVESAPGQGSTFAFTLPLRK